MIMNKCCPKGTRLTQHTNQMKGRDKMGAQQFYNSAKGATAAEAFKSAVEQAQYDHGHSGYSGTIAEKEDFTMIELPAGREPQDYADHLFDKGDQRIDDKWGPAGC